MLGLGVLKGLYGWAGIWIPLLLLIQLTQLGLKPALAEQARLRALTPEVETRYQRSQDAFEWLKAEVIAWQDPVYRERLRRVAITAGVTDVPEQPDLLGADADPAKVAGVRTNKAVQ